MNKGKYIILLVLFFVLLGAAAAIALLFGAFAPAADVPARAYLEIGLSGPLEEIARPNPVSTLLFGYRPLSVRDLWANLRKAKADDRVRAVVLRIGLLQADWAKMNELREAVLDFRAAGKPVYAYIEEAPDFDKEYFLALACDRIVLHPLGWLGVNGIGGRVPFFRTALDRLGIRADFVAVGDYKTANNQFTETGFTPAHAEELESVYGDIFAGFVRAVADSRGLAEDEVRRLIDTGLFQGDRAKEAGLVDDVLYDDQLKETWLREDGRPLRRIGLSEYDRVRASSLGLERGRRVAVIYGLGPILPGESMLATMGGATVSRWLRAAREDKSIAAIVFRVDSPGGSSVASDVIAREVALAKKAKPVVVSMSDVAGSGGYWVAMDASAIVAHPQTITGSIGVLAGKFSLRGLYEKLGITSEPLIFGARSDIYSTFRDFTPEERQALRDEILWTYDRFVERVALGRNMSPEAVREVAQGRIWTGRQALERGLVDELGGLDAALRRAKSLAGIPESEEVRLVVWPRRRSFWDALLGGRTEGADLGLAPRIGGALEVLRRADRTRIWAIMPWAVTGAAVLD